MVSVNERGHVVGQDHHRAKLSDHDIDLIVELREDGMGYAEIAAKFEISKGMAHDYCNGRRRLHTATGQRSLAPPRQRHRFKPARPDEFDTEFA